MKKSSLINSGPSESVREALDDDLFALADELAQDATTIARLTELIFSQRDPFQPPS